MTAEQPVPSASSRRYRWALLGLTALMGVALIASSVAGFLRARRDAEGVARMAGRQMARVVVRELVRSEGSPSDALDWALDELQEEGLRYAAVCRPRGECLVEAGERLGPRVPESPPRQRLRNPRRAWHALEPYPVAGGKRLSLTLPLRPGPRGRGGPGLSPRRPVRPPGDPRLLVLEYEPRAARVIGSRATVSLLIGLGSAGLLLLVTGVVWRLSARAERYERQLSRDRELKKLGEVSAVLGHQLRNPLASLKGHAQLLVERLPGDAPGRDGAETVVREASRLEALTDQILEFVKTGSVDLEPVDPAALLRAVAERWPQGRVVVEASGAPDRWPLDRSRMEQALVNVVDNAVEVSPPDAPVRLEAQASGERLLLRVADRGPGIRPGDRERIFEPFYTQRVSGTGLGLALARRIAEGHGGTISAHPGADGGTEIRIELPGPVREEV